MRVISGDKRGISLEAVPGQKTRPTTDRVKESIFNIITPYIDGGKVLDLFAGSGALGIETLSRGAEFAVFIDVSFNSIKCIKKNLAQTEYQKSAEVYKADWKTAIDKLAKREMKFDYVFLDPPYVEFQEKIPQIVTALEEKNLLCTNAIIVCEHENKYNMPLISAELFKQQHYKYGNTGITVLYRLGGN
ncbi:16S rRNA (guanine(966)-N(2))-methyltransferase RsmD [Desulfuribacillus alkaliarsenatis]|uniref:16S rRNA (Guanine(966)-N(2))-methyltransferase RsmD n=1 Tax=Desulfuribacillus alkaliarsenatis TaxID=766136 RepID=A0A1E5G5T4_9FIRM|nr:16S rRNA (guanine(966)-N(2))-methyltransferase RsmD [Desulfuribacillus alkaliarsenatis]